MAFADDLTHTAHWSLTMAMAGPEGAINELPPAWRRAAYAALLAISMTASYFMFVAGPIANAKEDNKQTSVRVDKVENDIAVIRGDIGDLKNTSASRDQKIDDLKESVEQMSRKIDQLLMQRNQRQTTYPP